MNPANLTEKDISWLPPDSQRIATAYLPLLREMPLCLAPSFFKEIVDYEWQFPEEQKEFEAKLSWLSGTSPQERTRLFAPFAALALSSAVKNYDWLSDPIGFMEVLSAYLWQSGQIDVYHHAATALFAAMPPPDTASPTPRLVMIAIGRDATNVGYPLFRKLQGSGLHAVNVNPAGSAEAMRQILGRRAIEHPRPYGHWYIDGGSPWMLAADSGAVISAVSYPQLEPMRQAVLNVMDRAVREGTGPELLQSQLAHIQSGTKIATEVTSDRKLQHFYLSLFSEGAGTQIFSTSFVQWAGQQTLRHARPLTLCLRFAPRQRQESFNDLLSLKQAGANLDPNGSLIDADMASYYLYLELEKLTGKSDSAFIVWFEGNNQALAVGPSIPRATRSATPFHMEQLLNWVLAT